MDTRGRLVAGSHNRNEFVLINADENARVKAPGTPQFYVFLGFEDTHLCVLLFSNLVSNANAVN